VKLLINPLSPFARKARIIALEAGLPGIEEVNTTVSPVAPNETLARENPLVKIPALVIGPGDTLYDSRVICEYLDTLSKGQKFFPASGPERFTALRRQALTDGILDAAVLCRYELAVRPEALRWPDWIKGQRHKIFTGLAVLEREVDGWGEQFNIGQVGAACVLSYLDFRFADWDWRPGQPRLKAWYERIAKRPSVAATMPA
jgi:glutathione S-transferase